MRKGEVARNVLDVCDMKGDFVFVLFEWEGSVADSRILYDAISSEYIVKDQGYKLAVNKIKDDIGMKTDGLEYLLFSNDKQGKELKTFVNKRIKELKKDGTLTKLSKEYFGGDYVSHLK